MLLFVSKPRVCVCARARVCIYVCFFPLQYTTVIIMIMLILITMLFLFLSNLLFILICSPCFHSDGGFLNIPRLFDHVNEIIVPKTNTTSMIMATIAVIYHHD